MIGRLEWDDNVLERDVRLERLGEFLLVMRMGSLCMCDVRMGWNAMKGGGRVERWRVVGCEYGLSVTLGEVR